MSILANPSVDQKVVLSKALLNAANQLGLKPIQLASVIGVHPTAISQLKINPYLDPTTKQGELALLLIQVYRGLYALSGSDTVWIQYFMNSYNQATKGIPIEQIQTISGLIMVLNCVDALISKV